MTREGRIARNTAVLTAGRVAGDLATFVFVVFLARRFGAAVVGQYAFGMAFGAILAVLMGFGVDALLEREVSRAREKGPIYVGGLLPVQAVLGILVALVTVVLAQIIPLGAQGAAVLVLIAGYHILGRLTMTLLAQFAAHQDFHYSALLDSGHRILILVLGYWMANASSDPVVTLSAYPVSALIALGGAVLLSSRAYGKPRFTRDTALARKMFLRSLVFFLIHVLAVGYDRVGLLILGLLRGQSEVGVFSVPDRLLTAVVGVIAMLEAALFPAFCRLAAHDPSEFLSLHRRAVRFLVVALIPTTAVIWVWSREIIVLLFGIEYLESVQVLRILSLTLLFGGLGTVTCSALLATNQERALVKILAGVLAVYVALCVLLIPGQGPAGLAWARLVGATLLFVLTSLCAGRSFPAGIRSSLAAPAEPGSGPDLAPQRSLRETSA